MKNTAKNIHDKTITAIFWIVTEQAGAMLVQFILGIILARLLSPAEFGVIGMVNIFLALSLLLIDSGLGQALIYKKNTSTLDENTLFYFNVVVGLAVSSTMALSSGWIADFYQRPQLKYMCMVLALNPLFNAFGFVQYTLLKKNLNFRPLSYITLLAVTGSGLAGVIAAKYGMGVWALVIQNLTNNFLRMIGLWLRGKWWPKWMFSWVSLRELGGYGCKILVSGMSDVVFKNLYSVIIGKLYSPAMLGYYSKAYNLEQLPGRFLQNIIARVSFSSFSSLNSNYDELKRYFRKSVRLFLIFSLPTMVGLGLLARPLIVCLITDKWLMSVPLLQILCISSPLYLLLIIEGNLIKSLGFPGVFFLIDSVKKLLLIVLIYFFYDLGVPVLIWIDASTTLCTLLLMRIFTMRQIGYTCKEQLEDCIPYLGLVLLMGSGVYLLGLFTDSWPVFWQLVMGVLAGVVLYIVPGIIMREPLMVQGVVLAHRQSKILLDRIKR